ncbi:MAG TPA: Ig-like domain-containing protein [Abditibacteriaceae bacterium]|jgi:hypothetical protein
MKLPFSFRAFAVVAALGCSLWSAHSANAAVVNVTYTDSAGEGFNDPTLGAARRAAFEAAAGFWGGRLSSTVEIDVDAHFDSLGGASNSATLATCGPSGFLRDWGSSASPFQASTFYPQALADKLAGKDLDPDDFDMEVTCNADVDNQTVLGATDWYYGTDGNRGGDIDFFSTVIHELGHGLGFIDTIDSNGAFLLDGVRPAIYDRFLENGNIKLTSLTQSQRASALISTQLFFNGSQTRAANGGLAARLYAPAVLEGGSSVSHLDETTFSGNNESMTPYATGLAHDPGPVASAIFRDMGWGVGASDTTPPVVTASYPTAGVLTGFTLPGAGTATDSLGIGTRLVPGVSVLLRLDSDNIFWNSTGQFWQSSSAGFEPKIPSTFNAATGAWGVAQSAWPSGFNLFDRENYTLFVVASDTAGNKTTLQRAIRIDKNPPTVAWSPLTNGQTVTDLTNIGGSIALASRVQFQIIEQNAPATNRFWNGSAWQNANADGTGPFLSGAMSGSTWNRGTTVLPTAAQLRIGAYRLVVRATNSFGTSVEASIGVSRIAVDIIAPTLVFVTPANLSAVNTLTILSGTVADNAGGSGVTSVSVQMRRASDGRYWNGTSWSTTSATIAAKMGVSPGDTPTWRLTDKLPIGTNLIETQYNLFAKPRDAAGNIGQAVAHSFSFDATAPTISITAPISGTISSLPAINGTASDARSGVAKVTFTLRRNIDNTFWRGTSWGAQVTLSTNLSGSNWSNKGLLPTGSNLLNGTYTLTATSTDKATNTKTLVRTFTVAAGGSTASASASSVALSSASANTSGAISLVFTGALGAGSANTESYNATVDGVALDLASATQPSTSTVVLSSEPLPAGTRINLNYNVPDAQGRLVSGTATITVR